MLELNFGLPVFGQLTGIIAIIFGILVLAFPRILNYLIGLALVLGGISSIVAGALLPGILSLVFGIVIFIFPQIGRAHV